MANKRRQKKLKAKRNLEDVAERRIATALEFGARELNLSGLELTTLPANVNQLTHLHQLNISNNYIQILPNSIGQLLYLQQLNVSNNYIQLLPNSIGQLSYLQQLNVSNNQISTLPDSIGLLPYLRVLNISCNRLMTFPDSIGLLIELRSLNASQNRLTALPASMNQLSQLQDLILHDNPGLQLPLEILGFTSPGEKLLNAIFIDKKLASPSSILSYYFNSRDNRRPLNEAKMILVGRGGAGKTSLVRRLVNATFNPREKKTDGIAITPWPVTIRDDQVRLNIWDFGGQEIMHATHQFFMTQRSLYLLVLNAREGEQDANLEYWLRLIESFGGDSPVIVVVNQIKQHQLNLNHRGLQEKFPAIREFIETDCEAEIGLDALQRAIERETDRLEHVRDSFPVSWFTVKDRLANLKENYITYAQYRELCTKQAVTEPVSQDTLVKFLHDLGIVVNFRDDARLADTHVLNPEWVTNGIYKILNNEPLAQAKAGELRLAAVSTILDETVYPRGMHRFLLDLMGKFELCYEFYSGNGEYLVPELLGKEEPDTHTFAGADALRFEYHYNILPEGLLPRFIVRSRVLNKDLPRWRTGALLAFEGNQALVKADVQDKKVSIAVIGNAAGQRRLLSVIRADFEDIHRSITKLKVAEKVPVPGYPGVVADYQTLRALEERGRKEFPLLVDGDIIDLNVTELLDGVEEFLLRHQDLIVWNATAETEAVHVVFSYSHQDEELRDQLETHLKLLQRQGIISTWHDRKIAAGTEWKDAIDDNFRHADVILLLTSADFIASDYCYDIEMKSSLERHEKGEAAVIPVILRTCQWQASLFGKLQALPKDGKPVTRWEDRDEAWNDVANGITKIVEHIRYG